MQSAPFFEKGPTGPSPSLEGGESLPVQTLALVGRVFLLLFNPQVRTGRLGFLRGLALWAAAGAAAWLLMDPIADAQWISDAALVVIARIYAWAAGLWSVALMVLAARRCHDLGWSGAWALLMGVPFTNVALGVLLLFLPGDPEARRLWSESAAE
ncbi:DUF805 domain-containing protein [uncultured Sutterella sp.]|uniref:DUF805 domain-containing protein n=1 Tax=uncultured Sutterella sp. TaxID=286133 RepID=UPI0025F5D19F|nr:DUF805 domain-containing protein [uncultured Sutterella sp.]